VDYAESTLHLRIGDVIIFASDGVLESENAEGEEFGFARLRGVLTSLPASSTVDDFAGAILRATDEFTGSGNPAHDDRTLLVARVTQDSSSDLAKMPVIY